MRFIFTILIFSTLPTFATIIDNNGKTFTVEGTVTIDQLIGGAVLLPGSDYCLNAARLVFVEILAIGTGSTVHLWAYDDQMNSSVFNLVGMYSQTDIGNSGLILFPDREMTQGIWRDETTLKYCDWVHSGRVYTSMPDRVVAVFDNRKLRCDNFEDYGFGESWHQVFLQSAIPGDTDLNGIVDAADLFRVTANMGRIGSINRHDAGPLITDWSDGDINLDQVVDMQDYAIVMSHMGMTTAGTSSMVIPEPLMALPLCLAGFLLRRRRRTYGTERTDAAEFRQTSEVTPEV